MHENRETSEAPAAQSSRTAGEGSGRTARIRLVDRCTVLGVRIIGIEIFTTEGQVLDIEIPEADSNSWCVSFVQKYQERIDLSICATYEVPDRVLNMPPESLKSLDQA